MMILRSWSQYKHTLHNLPPPKFYYNTIKLEIYIYKFLISKYQRTVSMCMWEWLLVLNLIMFGLILFALSRCKSLICLFTL